MNLSQAERAGLPYYITTTTRYAGVAPVSATVTRGVVYFASYRDAVAHCARLNQAANSNRS